MPFVSHLIGRIWKLGNPIAGFSAGQGLLLLANVARVPVTIQVAGVTGYADVLLLATVTAVFSVVSFGVGDLARVELQAIGWRRGAVPKLESTAMFVRRHVVCLLVCALIFVALATLPLENFYQSRWVGAPALCAIAACLVFGCLNIMAGPYLAMLEVDGRLATSNAIRGAGAASGLAFVVVGFQFSPSAWVSAALWGIGTLTPFVVPARVYGLWSSGAGSAVHPIDWKLARIAWIPFISFAATAFDPFAAQIWLDSASVTDYGVANRLAVIVLFIPLALRSLLWLRLGVRDQSNSVFLEQPLVIVVGFMASAVPGALVLASIGPWLATWVTGNELGITTGLYIVFGLSGTAAAGCLACLAIGATTESAGFSMQLALIGSISNVALSFALTPVLDVMGPAIAGAVCNLGMLMIWVRRFKVLPI